MDSYAVTIADAVNLVPEVRAHLSAKALLILQRIERKGIRDLHLIMARYHDDITQALIDYLENAKNLVATRNAFKRAVVEAFAPAFDLGYQDGGGALPITPEANDWLNSRVDEELGHVEMLFQQARELRKEPDFQGHGFQWATERADGYTGTLRSVYGAGKMWANRQKMLTWVYGETEHCDTCLSLNGQRHKALWYINRDYIPRKPGAAMDCGGYQCQCTLLDDEGAEFTIGGPG